MAQPSARARSYAGDIGGDKLVGYNFEIPDKPIKL